ncbi:MAG: prolipoprotein diacylglyceryl transferase [Akkermansiaceae bacterium]|jgi:phosphatidylglycerol---prolipoprotein diacylglyceryl transferase|nr:prolipoprotein diacylglyceryl transferase [Akkermansiaceae bacterium]MDG1854215.1 prolipoprotein diacylglyceryl transferase [Verrucomicrobiales bacterium]
MLLGYYLHDLSPFLIRFSESIGVRWYGLAYVAAFITAYFLLKRFVRLGYSELRQSQLQDFITYGALSTMAGGRLGYMFLYNFEEFINRPQIFFYFLEGGMASHGGIAGLIIFTFIYSRKHKVGWRGIGDNLCTVAPLGLCFGRLANFINGELYGRKSNVPWAVQFPEEIRESEFASPDGLNRSGLSNALGPSNFKEVSDKSLFEQDTFVIERARESEEVQGILREYLNARHPSQIYQALLEGLALFIILYLIRKKGPSLHHGILTGTFFIGYAVFRIIGEFFREPSDGYIGSLTRGQFFSTFMILIGIVFIASAYKWPKKTRPLKVNGNNSGT